MAPRNQKIPKKAPAGKPRRNKRPWNHTHLIILALCSCFFLTVCIVSVLVLFVSLQIPAIRTLSDYHPPLTTQILDRKGEVIDRIFVENRFLVPLAELPPLLPKAFLASEDARFFEHSGVDGWSILRALLNNLQSGERSQGGSTITQQVARALLLSPEKTYSRKVKEAILAHRIDRAFSKQDILSIYLNQIYFGEGAYGIEAAGRTYFGRSARELSLAEMALLAGLPQAPSRYSPFKHLDLAKKRQAYVLNRMAEDGYITATAARKAFAKTLLWGPRGGKKIQNQYYLQQVKNRLRNTYGQSLLSRGGLTIHTFLDQEMQTKAAQAIQSGVSSWKSRHPKEATTGLPQAALIALEPQNGKIRALMGGLDFKKSQFDRSTQARRQPGSAFKPLIYAVALEKGMTPGSIFLDEPLALPGARTGSFWRPENFSGENYGPTTLRDGLVFSRNIVTIKILQQIGVSQVTDLARRLGIGSPLTSDLSLALGVSEVSLLELTGAYACFANGGMFVPPVLVDRIIDTNGRVIEKNQVRPKRILSSQAAFQITNLMEKVIEEGTGRMARGLMTPAAGKTGTSDGNMDAWFIGYTPALATGVWMGFDRKKSLARLETGGRAAAPIWREFMQKVEPSLAKDDFDMPAGMALLPMNLETGELGDADSARTSMEAFRLPFP